MATQGLFTKLNENKEVEYKIITGSDGYNIDKLTLLLKTKKPKLVEEIYNMALSVSFGGKLSLVVLTKHELYTKNIDDFTQETLDRYHNTFHNPTFNPRWEYGTADYVKVVDNNFNDFLSNY